jgi:hypothetical protein
MTRFKYTGYVELKYSVSWKGYGKKAVERHLSYCISIWLEGPRESTNSRLELVSLTKETEFLLSETTQCSIIQNPTDVKVTKHRSGIKRRPKY